MTRHFIFMKGNSVKDGAMWEFLRRLRVHPGERHEVFGDVRKLVTEEFVRQKYLDISPIPLTDPVEFKFQWGPRAAKETSRRELLQFVATVRPRGRRRGARGAAAPPGSGWWFRRPLLSRGGLSSARAP
uniref:NSE3 homolog, SMC5-SMC6 complex component n=1 Tax=Nothoprocta perdicaria TaxID=30464 RepID=A0A8C6ZNF5_NOTPE